MILGGTYHDDFIKTSKITMSGRRDCCWVSDRRRCCALARRSLLPRPSGLTDLTAKNQQLMGHVKHAGGTAASADTTNSGNGAKRFISNLEISAAAFCSHRMRPVLFSPSSRKQHNAFFSKLINISGKAQARRSHVDWLFYVPRP